VKRKTSCWTCCRATRVSKVCFTLQILLIIVCSFIITLSYVNLLEEENDSDESEESEVGKKAASTASRRKVVAADSDISKLETAVPTGVSVASVGKQKEAGPLVIDGIELDRNVCDLISTSLSFFFLFKIIHVKNIPLRNSI
jgi:hypothetical protein